MPSSFSRDLTLSRRGFTAGLAAAAALAVLPLPALALTADAAKSLVDKTVADINSIINSGKSEAAMLKDFEKLFARYADVPAIARSVLGTAARSASSRTWRRLKIDRSSSPTAKPRSSAEMHSPSAMITARLMQFSSSRTLPGQR